MGRAEQIESISTGGLQDLATAIRHMSAYIDARRERIRLLKAVIENFPDGLSLFDKNLEMVALQRAADGDARISGRALRR
jgi:hypothetical protein